MTNPLNMVKSSAKNAQFSPRSLPAILSQINLKRQQAKEILLQNDQGDNDCDSRNSVSDFQQLSSNVLLIQNIKRSILSLQQYADIVESYQTCMESHLHEVNELNNQINQQMMVLNISNPVDV